MAAKRPADASNDAKRSRKEGRMAILSVYDKTGLVEVGKELAALGINLVASGGTSKALRGAGLECKDVADITKSPEMLGGRVKTLHPAVHGGILAKETEKDMSELAGLGYGPIDFVFCNLYPFLQAIARPDVTVEKAVEEVDIGGVTLLRAAAKNHARVTILCDPKDYAGVIAEMKATGEVSLETRKKLAVKAFEHTSAYDSAISGWFRKTYLGAQTETPHQMTLRYGCNPHQIPAQIWCNNRPIPFTVASGSPGYINLLDALNSWALVRELKVATGLPAAASFKHVSPAGAAVGVPLTDVERQVCQVDDLPNPLSALASAYARARGADRMCSFGDWAALSDVCDAQTARILSREVSDGVIAAGFSPEALEILKKKKGGKYTCLTMDPDYVPDAAELRNVYGLTMEQPRNACVIDESLLTDIKSKKTELSADAKRDLVVAAIAAKYTQSNSVVYVHNGMTVGVGAGQQSRIHCTRLAGDKADNYRMRFHPNVLGLKFKAGTKRADKANAIDLYVTGDAFTGTVAERKDWEAKFDGAAPAEISSEERSAWLKQHTGLAVASDAFFPFSDNIHRVARSGVRYIVAPGGSQNDALCVEAADGYDMVVCHTKLRLFHH